MNLQIRLDLKRLGQLKFDEPAQKEKPKPLSINEKKQFKKRPGLQNFGIDKENEPQLTSFF